ncbi:MAG: class I SAM-dependent methyltransferase [Anaerolineales bacterium]|jgi:ubiquinone/menaquinone biosynthesis C-methylase UbiE|uniref:class I SAM-dependent methyltransferase n=1 Tax=Candidatus Villigracilis vicinus TaxID=3140679 RepID=UPI003136829E|nr:class I SAM-dependent methyltransferase [Anaerolineales bacterium]MBK7450860.1 class I SAM-dependent methyltransferase [Anaerolineales bacterium]MBK9782239.1 class I SAM-dependent methyltransferase [Anaerolineales bacterium]
MPLQKDPENIERKTLQRLVDFSNACVLEVGCGEGRLTFKYANSAKQVIAFDPDHDALRVAKADARLKGISKIQFTEASASHIPFSKETFDIAILAWSL